MKSALHLAMLLLPAVLSGCAREPVPEQPIKGSISRSGSDFVSPIPDDSPAAEMDRAFDLEKTADIVVEYLTNGTMGIVPAYDGTQLQSNPSRYFQPDQLIVSFDSLPRKNLVVVIIAKQNWPDERLKSEITMLNHYFFSRGYKRVVIQQARSYGRPTHSDRLRSSSP